MPRWSKVDVYCDLLNCMPMIIDVAAIHGVSLDSLWRLFCEPVIQQEAGRLLLFPPFADSEAVRVLNVTHVVIAPFSNGQ